MGFLKLLVTQIAIKKAEDVICGKVEKDLPVESQKKKPPVFKSGHERAGFASFYFFTSQACYTIFPILCLMFQEKDLSLAVFFRLYAMAALVSFALLLIGLVIYGLYRVNLLPVTLMIFPLPLFFIMYVGFEYGWGIFRDIFFGTWMNLTTMLILILLGISAVVCSISILCYYESGGSKKKTVKQAKTSIRDEEAERTRNLLRAAIRSNSVKVCFLHKKWNFAKSEEILFGYDEVRKQFVFINDKNSHVLSSQKVVYLDFESELSASDTGISTNEYQIKLFYVDSGNKESVLSMALSYEPDGAINRIKYYANNNPAGNSEVVFRRKIRHLAATLDREFYPCRPFACDEWFEQLKECMGKIKNNKTDGYSLFRDRVIDAEDYMDDEILVSIISDMSIDPPDKTSAKKEARRLCLNDFGTSLKDGIKTSFKNFF